MPGFSSLSGAVSALTASQNALNTTAHNLTNVNTTGYVRQQVLFADSSYMTIGRNNTTGYYVGLGVDVDAVRQIRDRFLDESYREEVSRYGFYEAQSSAVEEIETILGETEGESFATTISALWSSMSELSKDPDGLETRGSFVQNAVLFVDRANLIMQQLDDYQNNLNAEVKDAIGRINEIGDEIDALNETIVKSELNGDSANDYRDQRNNLLDELAKIVDISYREDASGNVLVRVENVDFVTLGGVNKMTTAEAETGSLLVKPVWSHLDPSINDVLKLKKEISTENDNDKGTLKGLLMARGTRRADYTDLEDAAVYDAEVEDSIIMKAQAQFDNLIHGIVTMINDVVAPQANNTTDAPPYGLDGSTGVEIFKRLKVERYDAATGALIVEDSTNPTSLYSAGNIEVNPDVLKDYDKICLSTTTDEPSDTTYVAQMLTKWNEPFSTINPKLSLELSFDDYYTEFVAVVADVGSSRSNTKDNQNMLILQIQNERDTLTGVSSDEELGNLIRFQHSYNAAAKVVSMIDSMMEQIVQSVGLVGR